MTSTVSLLGMFAPVQGARDSKVTDDNALASFAGVLAGVNQANAKLLVPTPQGDSPTSGDELENAEDGNVAGDVKTDDSTADVAATATTASTNPNAVNASVAALNPALQDKLARVISRMRDETGHDVQVAETYRSQGRQNALYAQGRQTDGPVVTWTQNSKHTQGRAVDVTLDGGRASADAYTTLQRIANEEGLRTLGAKDPGHLELPSKSAATNQALNDVISASEEPADASGPGQISVARLAQIAPTATVDQVTSVARVATVANAASGSRVRSARAISVAGHASGAGAKALKDPATKQLSATADQTVNIADGDVAVTEPHDQEGFVQTNTAFAQADGTADTSLALTQAVLDGDVTMADATGASSDDHSLMPSTPNDVRPSHKGFEISNLDRLSDAVNATRVEDGSAQPNSAPSANKQRVAANEASYAKARIAQSSVPSIGRSSNGSRSFSSDRHSSNDDATGYTPMLLRTESSQVSVADIATDMTSTASQRAEQILAAQDAPARPLSQIVMSIDNGNGTSDRIQVGLRGSTVNATIDSADHYAADAMRSHSDDLVRSLTRDGVDVESVRVRNTATTTTAAQVTTVDSSRKSSDTPSNSRFNRDAQANQQRSQQRSNGERRQQQREQRGGKE